MSSEIRLEHVTKRFGATVAVDDVTLAVRPEEILALLGPSGCGKTTLLRLIAGFEAPDAGTVAIGPDVVAGGGRHVPPERRRVGMVFQDYALFPHLDIRANVAFGLPRGDRERRIEEVLRLVGLSGLDHRLPNELSGGQQQRVALARAMAPGPEVILLDEPFSNLDSRLRAQVRAEVRAILLAARTTAVFVTHDQEEAFSLADRVAVMWQGRILQVGTPQDVYRHPGTREAAEFVGEAEFLPGTREGDSVVCELGRLPGGADAGEGTAVEVMLRPEYLRVVPTGGVPATVVGHEYYGHDQAITARLPSGRLIRVRLGPFEDYPTGGDVLLGVVGEPIVFPRR
jgi:iron(III) transport system ATP-binding protein